MDQADLYASERSRLPVSHPPIQSGRFATLGLEFDCISGWGSVLCDQLYLSQRQFVLGRIPAQLQYGSRLWNGGLCLTGRIGPAPGPFQPGGQTLRLAAGLRTVFQVSTCEMWHAQDRAIHWDFIDYSGCHSLARA